MAAIVKKAVNSCEDDISDALKTAPIVDERDAIRRSALNPELKGLHELKALIPKLVKMTTGLPCLCLRQSCYY